MIRYRLIRECGYACSSFVTHLTRGLTSRPYGLAVALLLFFVFSAGLLIVERSSVWKPGVEGVVITASIAVGLAGFLYSALSYHVASNVDRSIRESINDFRDFLVVVEEIVGEAVKQSERSLNVDQKDDPAQEPDLILLLWFPFYALTRDLNSIGKSVNSLVSQLHEMALRSHVICAADPLDMMSRFDRVYREGSKSYERRDLDSAAVALRNAEFLRWKAEAARLFPSPLTVARRNLTACIQMLGDVLGSTNGYYTVSLVENDQLMNGIVQIVYSRKRAAIVFMPPLPCASGAPARKIPAVVSIVGENLGAVASPDTMLADLSPPTDGGVSENGEELKEASCDELAVMQSSASAANPFSCSGFATSDPFMIRMIRQIVRLRHDV